MPCKSAFVDIVIGIIK